MGKQSGLSSASLCYDGERVEDDGGLDDVDGDDQDGADDDDDDEG